MPGAPPPPPAAAARVFGDRIEAAIAYADLLATEGVVRGLLGPHEVPRLWERHLLNCAVLESLIPVGASVVDVGAGAGLPGIVLALVRSDLSVLLVEPQERRVQFLRECVEDLGLRARVRRARAEDLIGVLEGDVVTARAVAPLDRLLPWTVPLARPGGTILAVKGDRAGAELLAARLTLRRLRVRSAEVRTVGEGVVCPPTRVVVVRRGVGEGTGQGHPARRRGGRR